MNEAAAERIKIAASELATAESGIMLARKKYRRALMKYDEACQLRLPVEEKGSS